VILLSWKKQQVEGIPESVLVSAEMRFHLNIA